MKVSPMKMRRILCHLAAAIALQTASAGEAKLQVYREGDIVFSSAAAGQGGMIMAATGSSITHCGIIFLMEGKPMVLEARQPVGVSSLEQFKAHCKPGYFTARRLKSPVSVASLRVARTWAEAQIGKNYDARFLWDDTNLYCSELVWKTYQKAGVELCEPRHFRDYHLDEPRVRKVIEERFGSIEKLPMDEKVVAPSDLIMSPLLVEIPAN